MARPGDSSARPRKLLSARLDELFTPEEKRLFLRTPQPLLEDRRPADMILEGDGGLIHQMLDRIEDGAFI